jgi:hypothetical protein
MIPDLGDAITRFAYQEVYDSNYTVEVIQARARRFVDFLVSDGWKIERAK